MSASKTLAATRNQGSRARRVSITGAPFYGDAPIWGNWPSAGVCYPFDVELRRFFDRAVRATFRDLTLHDEPVAGYLVDLLTRFARTDQLFPAGVAVPRLEAIVDVLLEAQAAWDDASPHFSPEREVSARRQ